ncbi:hypothetical protein PanWU01x14_094900 [Parasponia andersonii]|uniref:Uncharacterized protein n=1 Tax=Parasponia andersonii TaxID=3476 RepID=A0A2P5D5E2_PARAD|nr:hypothetical protein PanWU01x14_094900 [Parasponia andersonii]
MFNPYLDRFSFVHVTPFLGSTLRLSRHLVYRFYLGGRYYCPMLLSAFGDSIFSTLKGGWISWSFSGVSMFVEDVF